MSEAEKLDTIQKAGGEADVVDTASATAEATPEVVAAETETTAAAPAAEEPAVQASEESDETPAEEAVSEEDSFRLLYEAS